MATTSSASISSAESDKKPNPPQQKPLAKLVGPAIHPALTEVACEIEGNQIQLFGQVPTFYLKQLAQETASRLPKIQVVLNHIQVCSAPCNWR